MITLLHRVDPANAKGTEKEIIEVLDKHLIELELFMQDFFNKNLNNERLEFFVFPT